MKSEQVESDRVAVVCSHCHHKFVIDVAKIVADNPDFKANPTYLPARCPECFLATVVNIVNSMSTQRPILRKAR